MAAHSPSQQGDAGHADLMDGIYRTQRHFYDLTRKYYLLGRDRMIRALDVPVGGTVLEVGCGTGRNLIAVARRYPDCRLFGLDISEAMLERARASVARAGLSDRIVLVRADATDFDALALFGVPGFDRVFCSYTLSMIPGWQKALAASLHACKSGGTAHVVDFGDQAGLPRWFAALLRAWLAKFHVSPRTDMPHIAQTIAALTESHVRHDRLYRGYAQALAITRR